MILLRPRNLYLFIDVFIIFLSSYLDIYNLMLMSGLLTLCSSYREKVANGAKKLRHTTCPFFVALDSFSTTVPLSSPSLPLAQEGQTWWVMSCFVDE